MVRFDKINFDWNVELLWAIFDQSNKIKVVKELACLVEQRIRLRYT